MKKIIAIVTAAVLSLALFAGCAPAASNNADGGAEIINPLKEYDSVDELAKATGIDVQLPHSAEPITIQSIDNKMNEIVFKVADGTQFTYRKAKSDMADTNGKDDISGYYIEWSDTHEATSPGGINVTVKTGDPENKESGIAVWNDGTYKYSIVMDKGYDEGMLLAGVDGVQ